MPPDARSSALAVWMALGACGVGGCYTDPPRAPAGAARYNAAEASPPPQQPTFDARLVDPRFEQAVIEYWRDLRTLRWDSMDNEIRRSLRLLAIAAERVPYTGRVDLATAATRVRGGRSHGPRAAAGNPVAAAGVDALDGPLQDLARAFIELAREPYREGVGVLAAAYAFEHAVQEMSAARARGGDRRASFETLRRGEEILLAIRGAIARGEVGLMSAAPPPADFGD